MTESATARLSTRLEPLLQSGTLICLFIGVFHVVCWAAVGLGVARGGGTALLATAVYLGCALGLAQGSWRQRLAPALAALGLVLAIALLSCRIIDSSYDGQSYHGEALLRLGEGWNATLGRELSGKHAIWLNHYPRATWITGEGFAALFHDNEAAKTTNGALLLAAFLVAARLFLTRLSALRSYLAAFIVAANPVALCQMLTFYLDGLVASGLACLVFLAGGWLVLGEPLQLLAFGLLLLLIVNAKFTAAIYVALLLAAVLGCAQLATLPRERVRTLALISAAALALGVLVIGYAPYVTNTLRHGHPFYPLFGAGALDVVTEQTPVSWRDDSPLLRLAQSLLSRPQSWIEPAPRLTLPFVFAPGDLKAFGDPDARAAGFGPFFSAALLGAVAVTLAALSNTRSRQVRAYVAFTALVAGSVLINPEAWWARWAPQLWLAAALTPPLLFDEGVRWRRRLGYGLACVLALNSVLVGGVALRKALKGSAVWHQTLAQLAEARDRCGAYFVVWGDHTSNRARLAHARIPVVEAATTSSVACSQWEPILPAGNERLTTVSICAPRAPLDSCLGRR